MTTTLETPTKADEIELLRAFKQSLPLDSYLRDIFSGIVPDIESAIRGDLGYIDFRGHVAFQQEELKKLDKLREDFKKLTETVRSLQQDEHRMRQQLNSLREDAEFVSRRLVSYRD